MIHHSQIAPCYYVKRSKPSCQTMQEWCIKCLVYHMPRSVHWSDWTHTPSVHWLIRLDACSRVGAHLSKLDPIQEIGPKIGLGISLRVVSLFGETVVLASVCSCSMKMISAYSDRNTGRVQTRGVSERPNTPASPKMIKTIPCQISILNTKPLVNCFSTTLKN